MKKDLYQSAIEAFRRGRPGRALSRLDRVIAAEPRHVAALCNRGLVLRALGRVEQAEASLLAALEVDPEVAGAWYHLARLRLEGGRPAEAVQPAGRAVALGPGVATHHLGLGMALYESGHPSRAVAVLERAAALDPGLALARLYLGLARLDHDPAGAEVQLRDAVRLAPELAPAWIALGRATRQQGRAPAAVVLLTEAARRHGQSAPIHEELGTSALEAGQHDVAERALRLAMELEPGRMVAAHALGTLLMRVGRAEEALAAHRRAVATDPPEDWPWVSFADAVAACVEPPLDLTGELVRCLARDGVNHQALDRAVRRILDALPAGTEPLVTHPLFRPWLERTICCHPDWEARLRDLRRHLLAEVVDGRGQRWLDALQGLAHQAFHTEYAWTATDEELAQVDQLADHPSDAPTLLAVAMYRPLSEVEALPATPPGPAAAVVHLQVTAPAVEQELAEGIEILGLTDDAVSVAVRAQYEDHPYPRLVSQHRKPAEPLHRLVHRLFPHFDQAPRPTGSLRVLVAGCGTGQNVLSAATRYANAQVLAIDLSRRSLGATARRVREWGLDQVQLLQADILALDRLEQRFHLVEAGGVIHHMADPLAGWRILVDRTEPGGLMKIGLYSERGRAGVVAARALLEEHGLGADDIRAGRDLILSLPEDHPARDVVWSPDFYSQSGFRDLVLHTCEHRFTLARLAEALDALGLEFVGFQHARPEPLRWYADAWPDDPRRTSLDRWGVVEEAHPRVFAGMYQFWCHRPQEPSR